MKRAWLLLLAMAALVAACSAGNGGDPAAAVESYLQAKIEGDAAGIRALLCSEMEAFLEREQHTFDSVTGVRLEDSACEPAGEGRVACSGKIVALYGAEETEFPLGTYRVVQEDGEWKWCGEA